MRPRALSMDDRAGLRREAPENQHQLEGPPPAAGGPAAQPGRAPQLARRHGEWSSRGRGEPAGIAALDGRRRSTRRGRARDGAASSRPTWRGDHHRRQRARSVPILRSLPLPPRARRRRRAERPRRDVADALPRPVAGGARGGGSAGCAGSARARRWRAWCMEVEARKNWRAQVRRFGARASGSAAGGSVAPRCADRARRRSTPSCVERNAGGGGGGGAQAGRRSTRMMPSTYSGAHRARAARLGRGERSSRPASVSGRTLDATPAPAEGPDGEGLRQRAPPASS